MHSVHSVYSGYWEHTFDRNGLIFFLLNEEDKKTIFHDIIRNEIFAEDAKNNKIDNVRIT